MSFVSLLAIIAFLSCFIWVQDGNITKFIIDTDAGADDAIAIMYLLGAEKLNKNFHVVGITCANGNTEVDNVVINVLKTLKIANRLDIPVYKGCSEPVLIKTESDKYFGEDGFGDFEFKDPPSPSLIKQKHAVNALIQLVKKRPGQYSLLCLAPLTNIALAIRMYPNFLKDVNEVFVLGGAVEGNGAMKPGIEFNFFIDPEAVFVVLKSAEELGKQITLLPSETFFNRGSLPMDWRLNVLGAINNSVVDFLNKVERKTLKGEKWHQADQLMAAVAINSSLVTSSCIHPVGIETCGSLSRGAVFVNYNCHNESSTVKIIKEIDMDAYKHLLLRYLTV